MRFIRPQVITRLDESDGSVPKMAITQQAMTTLLLGNGSIAGYIALPNPGGAYTANCTVDQLLNGNRKVYLNVHIVALGTLPDFISIIEFQDPDNPNFWIPSMEPAMSGAGGLQAPVRTGNLAAHEWTLSAAGNYVLASREEHGHFRRFRARFRSTGVPSAASDIRVFWAHDGERPPAWLEE